jgi:hypothetical protein
MMSLERAKRIIQAAPKADNELIEAHLVVFADKMQRNDLFEAGPVQNTVPRYVRVYP